VVAEGEGLISSGEVKGMKYEAVWKNGQKAVVRIHKYTFNNIPRARVILTKQECAANAAWRSAATRPARLVEYDIKAVDKDGKELTDIEIIKSAHVSLGNAAIREAKSRP
jgi:hypothetical protein